MSRRDARPRFSLISAAYDVARFLPEFIDSIDQQTFDLSGVEVIMVDDGSTDGSAELLRAWRDRRPDLVTVVEKENGGQAAARNLGLEHASGEWVSFPDPDDILTPGYLFEVDRCLREHPEVDLVGAARILLDDTTGIRSNTHPLRRQFTDRRPVVSLEESDLHFYGSAPCAFFDRDRLEVLQLRFDAEIRPNFEDGFFCAAYLLSAPHPRVAFAKHAEYVYRKRGDASSTLQRSLTDPDRYTRVLRRGYLGLLDLALAERGSVPGWIQTHLIYELSYYLSTQDRIAGFGGAIGETAREFHSLMRELVSRLDPALIERFAARALKPVWREILLHGYRDQNWHSPAVEVSERDTRQRLVKLTYRYCGTAPRETLFADGRVQTAVYAKTRAITYHEAELLSERILWVPARGDLSVDLDGVRTPLTFDEPRPPRWSVSQGTVRRELADPGGPIATTADPGAKERESLSVSDRLVGRLASVPAVRDRFKNAWVLMDRVHDAGDSAEVLFRYLRSERRRINAWFVIEPDTEDWKRLRAEGFRRVIPHGSRLWKLLMLNARHLISSHADRAIVDPPELAAFGRLPYRFTFLQHGVIKDDISAWLNPKPISVFVTSTPQERESIRGEHTPYVFTDKEVALTGLPRFDRLREIGRRYPADKRDLVLVTPTWRHWLVPPTERGSQRRELNDSFLGSDFVRQWKALLTSEELQAACRRHGLTLGFLPHPNLQSSLPLLDLPPTVRALRYDDGDVQALFARAAVLVTDYSSIAFNAAYLDRPVVYFQFDADLVLGGGHVGRRGYFDYTRDGFGPVTSTVEEATRATVASLDAGRRPAPPYDERISTTFPLRDGGCCARTVAAIEASARPPKRPV